MRHALLLTEFLSTPWAVEPTRLAVMAKILSQRALLGLPAAAEELTAVHEIAAAREARRAEAAAIGGGVGVVPIHGLITHRASAFHDVSGMTSTQAVGAMLREAVRDDTIDSILLDVDSPGGSVFGIEELADEIHAAKQKKPVCAIAHPLAASAAYWLGSQASEFYATPSAQVGSIGVFTAHEDWSRALDEQGVKVSLVSAGKYKTEANPYEPLGEEARAGLQQFVDGYYSAFVRAVARGRGVSVADVRGGMGQGRMLASDGAKTENMIDGVATFGEVVRKMQRAAVKPGATRAGRARADLAILG